jgi:hypothetical protein
MKITKEKPVIVVGPKKKRIKAVRMSDKPLLRVGVAAVRKGIVSW